MTDFAFSTPSRGQVPCSYHPDVQTGLRCSRCGKPICPKCSVRTPVGLRCPDCAGVRGLPTIRTAPDVLIRAGGLALLVGIITTALWYLFPEWKFYLSLLLGFGVAEAIAYVAKGKRGTDLQIVGLAIVTVVVIAVRVALAQRYGFSLDQISSSQMYGIIEDGRRHVGTPRDFMQMTLIPDLLFAAMACAIVWVRFR